MRRNNLENILEKCLRNSTDCLEYTGYLTPTGYAKIMHMGKTWQGARLIWFLHNKTLIPKNLLACHTCDNRKCLNIDHIFIGTYKDNHTDMVNKGRASSQNQTHCKYGHLRTEENIRVYTHPKTQRSVKNCRTCERINYYKGKPNKWEHNLPNA